MLNTALYPWQERKRKNTDLRKIALEYDTPKQIFRESWASNLVTGAKSRAVRGWRHAPAQLFRRNRSLFSNALAIAL